MRLFRALAAFFTPGSCLTWCTCWRHAKDEPRFKVVARDGFRYIEPRAARPDNVVSINQARFRREPAQDIQ